MIGRIKAWWRKLLEDSKPRDPEQHFRRGGDGDPYGQFQPRNRQYGESTESGHDEGDRDGR
jgi:hypothetical protein